MSSFDPKSKKDGFSREASNHQKESGYTEFTRDKRTRKSTVERVERTPRRDNNDRPADSQRTEHAPSARRSFNPNFDKDNRKEYGHSNDERKPYQSREHSDRGSSFERRPYEGKKEYGHSNDERKPYPSRERSDRGSSFERRPSENKKGYGRTNEERRPHRNSDKTYGSSGKVYGVDSKITEESKDYPRFNAPKADKEMRLNRFISISGICSRREADDLITAGVVSVNGKVVTELGAKVQPTDEVRFNGEIVQGEKKVYIVMNKPKGFVTSIEDPHADRTVIDLVKNTCTERVYPVGRLDKNSLGVLLITNDGDLTKRLTHPSHNKKKVYHVILDKQLSKSDMDKIAEGIELEDGPIAADAIEYVGTSKKEVGIEIHSGRNRIIRRIFDQLGYHVQKLDRVYFAGLTKQKLKRGQWRFLSSKEVAMLKSGEYE